jgi:hypothetical protein
VPLLPLLPLPPPPLLPPPPVRQQHHHHHRCWVTTLTQFRTDRLIGDFFELLGPRLTNNIEITRQAKLAARRQ